MTRRSYGTGSLFVRADVAGRETWYGRWHAADGSYPKRKIGPKRIEGTRQGLTRTQAESELRRLMAEAPAGAGPVTERLSLVEAAPLYVRHLETRGQKRSWIVAVQSCLRARLLPALGDKALGSVRTEDIEDLISGMRAEGVSAKTIRNYVGVLSAIYTYAMHPRRRWTTSNPCAGVELPPKRDSGEIRFLEVDEVRSLVAAAIAGDYQAVDRALYLTAAMTGLRQGELLALRWQDVDWRAGRVRVRQSYVLGEYGTPKSKRSTRSVPLAAEVGGEIDRLYRWCEERAGAEPAPADLVFADPSSGLPLTRSALIRRFRRALVAARLDERQRFHDLRHTFGTQMAAAGVSMRTLQEWMGHRDIETTQRYADYAPSPAHEAELIARAFAPERPEGASVGAIQA